MFTLLNAGIWLNALGAFASAVFSTDIVAIIIAGLTVVFVSVLSGVTLGVHVFITAGFFCLTSLFYNEEKDKIKVETDLFMEPSDVFYLCGDYFWDWVFVAQKREGVNF